MADPQHPRGDRGRPGRTYLTGPAEAVRRHFDEVRQLALARALEVAHEDRVAPPALLERAGLTTLTGSALTAWRLTWLPRLPHPHREGGWPWNDIAVRFHRRPATLGIALWYGEVLCGLGMSSPSSSRELLRINYIEGSPVPDHPFRGYVLPIVLEACHQYARVLGARVMELEAPLTAVVPRYERLGFRLARNNAEEQVYQREPLP